MVPGTMEQGRACGPKDLATGGPALLTAEVTAAPGLYRGVGF